MIPEYVYQILIGFMIVAIFVVFYRDKHLSDPIHTSNTSDTEFNPITQQLPVGAVSTITARNAERTAYRESLIIQADDKVTIFNLRVIVEDKNAVIVLRDEKISIQSDLLLEQAQEMEWDKKLIILQEGKIRVFEVAAAMLLHDGLEPRPYVVGMDRGAKL